MAENGVDNLEFWQRGLRLFTAEACILTLGGREPARTSILESIIKVQTRKHGSKGKGIADNTSKMAKVKKMRTSKELPYHLPLDDWFNAKILQFGSTVCRFSIDEFATITNLKCDDAILKWEFSKEKKSPRIQELYFPTHSSVSKGDLLEFFKGKSHFLCDEDAVKLA
ncbi:hypothetical protein TorRG33x02_255570 [Trema orientale]|uniref:DUF1985 domain-containing protein n=1 Tax=Trema orientale TaxID=63057 RepID=A0A2P5DCP3_TREOI|nr:hypothetical protein TorRG33x02_255570 [Trema orientale]